LPTVVTFDTLQGIGTVAPPARFACTPFTARFSPGRAPPSGLV
jgi:hypothetical protein